jgi:hypothetical protein
VFPSRTARPIEPVDVRLARLRGPVPPKRHNARTIAALTGNPGCARRAVLDAAGIDKEALARGAGFPARFGQSPFAIARGNAFEAMVKADGCAELLRLLRDVLGTDLTGAAYTDLDGSAGGPDDPDGRHVRAREALTGSRDAALYDHPLLRMRLGGRDVYLEPDLVALRHRGMFHVVEVKSFPVIDGRADPAKVAAAATQAAVYVLALRNLVEGRVGRPDAVSHEIVLVCPENFTNRPVAVVVDVRRQLTVLAHQIARLTRVEEILAGLPAGLTLDLRPDAAGNPTRPAAELVAALGTIGARYSPGCLSACELAHYCRDEARTSTAALGVGVREDLGGVETVDEVLALADGERPGPDRVEAAALLRTVKRVYEEATGAA